MVERRKFLQGAVTTLGLTGICMATRESFAASDLPPSLPENKVRSSSEMLSAQPFTPARWAFVCDPGTGTELLSKNADERMPPSSLTKMMTAYIVFLFLSADRIKLSQNFTVSEKAWRMGGSRMFLPVGKPVSIEDLLQGALVQSGNDACVALAEGIAGSEDHFAELMNEEAVRLGMKNSHFVNATGWPAEGHYMTARDIATLATALLRDFPQYYHFFGEKVFTYNHIRQENRNSLVVKGTADGLKTGHTDAGGYGLCASSQRGSQRVLVVVNGLASMASRAAEGERLMEWAFSSFEQHSVLKKGQIIVPAAPVWMGRKETVALVSSKDIIATIPKNTRQFPETAVYLSPLKAPLKAGKEVGVLELKIPGAIAQKIPLLVSENIESLGPVSKILHRITHYGK
ncbi:D-alanyl-D-alanine carboxypeptidase [Acetobacteraceae bacterium]|nr:D-alanyl-D-alanine carboxypeptidase [Acetobacteraceae bacterium]